MAKMSSKMYTAKFKIYFNLCSKIHSLKIECTPQKFWRLEEGVGRVECTFYVMRRQILTLFSCNRDH